MDMASTLSAVTAVSDTVQHQADCQVWWRTVAQFTIDHSLVYDYIPYPLQTSTERLIAECDEMLEKLMEMKKKLREMM